MDTRFTLKTGEKVFKRIHLLILILFLLLFTSVISYNPGTQLPLLAWGGVFTLLTSLRHFVIVGLKGRLLHWIFPWLEGGVLVVITHIDASGPSLGLITLLMMDVIIDYETPYGIIFLIAGYFTYMYKYMQNFTTLPLGSKLLLLTIAAVQIVLYMGVAFLAKMYNHQSHQLRRTTSELHAKMLDLEQMTLLKERNRIAGEIHNTVGHQLTTALVQIEAAQMLLIKDPEEAKKRLVIIKDQVRAGLQELRKSIQAINAEKDYEDFPKAVDRLLGQVETHTGIKVENEMDDISEIKLHMKKALYHVIMESVTNAIRHGHCQHMKINLSKFQDRITLSSFNDGIVPTKIQEGYGFNHMKESLKSLGGALSIKLNEEGWFGIVAELPLHYQEGEPNGQD